MRLELDRGGPPAYAQIVERVEAAVRRGELSEGDRLPPERRLAADLGVSRMTLRQALAALETRGLVTRTAGRGGGTFVSSPKLVRDLGAFAGLSEQLRRQNVTAGARILSATEVSAGEAVADALELGVGDPVGEIVRLRLANLTGSLYDVLAERYGEPPTHAVERLEPVLAGALEADALGVLEGAPLMLVERTAYAAGGMPVEFARDLFRGDRTRVVAWASALTSA
jgi:GntR family transcriptional regulator